MNWNGQRATLDHLITRRLDPAAAKTLQRDFDAKRRSRINSALCVRPLFVPLSFEMTAAAQTSPYRQTTPSLNYDVIITGIKADTQTRSIVVRRTEVEKPLCYVGEAVSLYLRADDIAGVSATNGGGQTGTFYLPQPIVLAKGQRLTVEMFKTDVTADPEEANIAFIGVRVLNREYANELLDSDEKARIDQLIAYREAPTTVFLKVPVTFDSALAGSEDANIYTPAVEEPLLVLGMRTTLRQSTISIGVEGEPKWTTSQTPIWAVAGEDEMVHENYQGFSKPIFLHSNAQIEIERIVNSIDGTAIDEETGNTITFICSTV